MFLGCLFQDRFLIVLGSVGVDLGTILAVKSHPNRRKNGIDFEIDFWCLAWKKLSEMRD